MQHSLYPLRLILNQVHQKLTVYQEYGYIGNAIPNDF
jgi:hypothetical protein